MLHGGDILVGQQLLLAVGSYMAVASWLVNNCLLL